MFFFFVCLFFFCRLSVESCCSLTSYASSPAYQRLVTVTQSQRGSSSSSLLRLCRPSSPSPGSSLLRGLNSDFPCTLNMICCGAPPVPAAFLSGSPKTSLPLPKVGPSRETLGHWRLAKAWPDLWAPASKWTTCLSLMFTAGSRHLTPDSQTHERLKHLNWPFTFLSWVCL